MCALSKLLVYFVIHDVCWKFAIKFPIKHPYPIKFALLDIHAMPRLMPLDCKNLFLKSFLRIR